MPDEVPVFRESLATAALDGARIACVTADALVALDQNIPEPITEEVRTYLAEAMFALNQARQMITGPTSSVHIVGGGGIIIPGT